MSKGKFIKAAVIAVIVTMGGAGTAHAQFQGINPGAFFPGGGRINPGGLINQGIGIIQEMDRRQRAEEARQQRAIAAQQARQRRAALQRTKAGRAQLAREDRAARQRAKQQEALMMGVIGAVGASIVGGGGGGGTRTEYWYEQRSGGNAPSAPAPSSRGFYGNCHGGSFYGC
jgi:hypothetical protein